MLELFQIDAFTDEPFSGNPAGVCLLEGERPAAWMQKLSAEMNLSETAFLVASQDGFNLRWFTPCAEVDLCGHATLASAHFLWETRRLEPGQPALFYTRSGLLTARLADDGQIEMDFPAEPAQACDPPAHLLEALGVDPKFVGRNRFDFLVEVASPDDVLGAAPDFSRLRQVSIRGVILTSRPNGLPYDFVSRFFAPAAGVDEDPVTGSAHCCLGPYWGSRLGKQELVGRQVSSRGGTVGVQLQGERVLLKGRALTVFRVQLLAGE